MFAGASQSVDSFNNERRDLLLKIKMLDWKGQESKKITNAHWL